jgi:hydroxymethylglutaryl-CoA lyase
MLSTPEIVELREVSPRDGLQNERRILPLGDKLNLIDRIVKSGITRIEVTSLVRSDVVPQLADAEDLLAALQRRPGVRLSALVPNLRGLERALRYTSEISQVNYFLSASEAHNRKNVNRSVAQSLQDVETALAVSRGAGLRNQASVSVSFGCPYEGRVLPTRVLEIGARLAQAGVDEISFADTTGMANPTQVQTFFEEAMKWLPTVELTAHFHNTRGQGLANVVAALQAGCTSFEASIGELGGCPVPPGSTGNLATEDLVSMLHEMGVATGANLAALIDCSRWLASRLGHPLTSHTAVAGPVEWR